MSWPTLTSLRRFLQILSDVAAKIPGTYTERDFTAPFLTATATGDFIISPTTTAAYRSADTSVTLTLSSSQTGAWRDVTTTGGKIGDEATTGGKRGDETTTGDAIPYADLPA